MIRRVASGAPRVVLLFALGLAWGAACGPVQDPPPSSIPVNACPQHSCDAFQQPSVLARPNCTAGVCTSATAMDFTLVVSLPESAYFDEGVTLAIPGFTAFQAKNPCPTVTAATCVQLPFAARPRGWFMVSPAVEASAGRPQIFAPGASLPAQVEFRPQWPVDGKLSPAAVFAEASIVGLPLMPVFAAIASGETGVPLGPAGTPGTQWRAVLGPEVYYRRYLVPEDDAFPAILGAPAPASDDFNRLDSVDPEAPLGTTVTVTRDGALDGFSVYVRDVATQLRVSSRATLHGAKQATVTLLTAGQSPFVDDKSHPDRKLELVVAPSEGSPIPTFADRVVVDHLGPTVKFPALPPYVAVSGTLRAADQQTPIEGDLLIESTATATTGGIITSSPQDPAQPHMRYSTTAHADADGRYSVLLPPGTYDAFLTPALGTNAGAVSVPLIVQPAPIGQPPIAAGKDLFATALASIRGVAIVADGRMLAGAVVEAHAATSLAGVLDPRHWPRTASTTTDENGTFTLLVDPGTYDVVVRPPTGTSFPWVTRASQTTLAGESRLVSPIAIPAPIALDLLLHDPLNNPLVNAIVSAYAPPGGGSPGPATMLQIGTWMTDAAGHVTMFVAPP